MKTPETLNVAFAAGDTATIVAESLNAEGVRTVLDIGCGRGGLARALTRRGFEVTGIDPGESAIAAAREAAPEAEFAVAAAENLGFEDAAFDGAVFLNSLHHVPEPKMDAALAEAVRVVVPGGPIVVVEPLAEGPFFEVTRLLDDETEVRAAAARAIADGARESRFAVRGNVVYERKERFADLGALIEGSVSVDPLRRERVEAVRGDLTALFAEHGVEGENGGRLLTQPLRIYLLRTPD